MLTLWALLNVEDGMTWVDSIAVSIGYCWDRLSGLVVLQSLSEIVTLCRFHSTSISLCKFSSFVVLLLLLLLGRP